MEDHNNNSNLDEWVERLNKRFALAFVASGTVVIDEDGVDAENNRVVDFKSVEAFRLFYSNVNVQIEREGRNGSVIHEPVNVAKEWLQHPDRRSYKTITFNPALPSGHCGDMYNLWKGFAVESKQGDCSFFWNHVREIICGGDEKLYTYVRKWMAHAIQRTDVLPGTALVLRGLEGIGKNTFADYFGSLFGTGYGMYSSMDKIFGQFNGHLKDKVVIFSNEALWGGDKRQEGMLKALITDPTRDVEMKGKDIFTIRNFARLIVASNNEWAVPAGLDARRFIYGNVSSARKGDHEYFAAIRLQMDNGGKQALLYDLLHEDISGWNPFQRPENNDLQGFDLKLRNMDLLQRFIFNWLNDGQIQTYEAAVGKVGCYKVPFKELYSEYQEFCKTYKDSHMHDPRTFSIRVFGSSTMPKAQLPFLEKSKDHDGRYYVLPNIKECRERRLST